MVPDVFLVVQFVYLRLFNTLSVGVGSWFLLVVKGRGVGWELS
jgi:hypothetical protein